MADYQEMYFTMIRASEKAIQILIEAQQKCEELYLSEETPSICLVSKEKEDK